MSWSSTPTMPRPRGTWTPHPAAPEVSEEAWEAVRGLAAHLVMTLGGDAELQLVALLEGDHTNIDATATADLIVLTGIAADLHVTMDTVAELAAILHVEASQTATIDATATIARITALTADLSLEVETSTLLALVSDITATLTLSGVTSAALTRIAMLAASLAVTAATTCGLTSISLLTTGLPLTLPRTAALTKIAHLAATVNLSTSQSCQLGFPPLAPVVQTYTSGSYSFVFPRSYRYIDRMVLGGGGGGSTGNQVNQEGYGGNAGSFAWDTLERGVDIPWAATTITGQVGAGGGTQANGSASTATIAGPGTLTGTAGTGRSDNGSFLGSARNGRPVSTGNTNGNRDLDLGGYVFAGGGESTGDTANVPGAGGRGGNGTTWPLTPGSGRPGARGEVRFRCRQ